MNTTTKGTKMTPQYETALNAVRDATQVYFAAATQYRAGEMTTAEYLAARAAYVAADDAFDATYRKECQ